MYFTIMSITTKIFMVLMVLELLIGLVVLSKPQRACPICHHRLQETDTICYSCGYNLDSVYMFNFWDTLHE